MSIEETKCWFPHGRLAIGTYAPLVSESLLVLYESAGALPGVASVLAHDEGELPIPGDWDQALLDFVTWRVLQRAMPSEQRVWGPFRDQYMLWLKAARRNTSRGTDSPLLTPGLQF